MVGKTDILIVILFYFSISTFSQNLILKGEVQSKQAVLPFSDIVLEFMDKSSPMIYTATDADGRYLFKNLEKNTYIVSVSRLGYENQKDTVVLTANKSLNFLLKESPYTIEEVIVESPITVKKDTVIYNVDKFINGTEKKLKNVLEQLPGVDVDRKGNVKLNGKVVKKLYIDGELFFGGNTKLGVNNIPSEVIDKISFIDNFNNVSFLKKYSDSDELIMNVKLKKDKKHFIFGDVKISLGNQSHYQNHNALFLYSPKTTLNLITDINDVGKKVFSFDDFVNFQGGFNTIFKDGFSGFFGRLSTYSQFLNDTDFRFSRTRFLALNASTRINKKTTTRAYAIYSNPENINLEKQVNQYGSFIEYLNTNSIKRKPVLLIKHVLNYQRSDKSKLYVTTKFKKLSGDYDKSLISLVSSFDKNIKTKKKYKIKSFNENIEFHNEISRKQVLSSVLDFEHEENTNNNQWDSNSSFLSMLIPLQNDTHYDLVQSVETKKNKINAIVKHMLTINDYSQMYTTVGNTFLEEVYKNNDYQLMTDGTINYFDSADFNNNTKLTLNTLFFGLNYKIKIGKTIFKPGLSLRKYYWRLDDISRRKTLILPSLKMNVNFSKSQKIKFSYIMKSEFSTLKDLTNKFQIYSYNTIAKGNSNLENEVFHDFSFSYDKFNIFRGYQFSTEVSYIQKTTSHIEDTEFIGSDYYYSKSIYNKPTHNWNYSIAYSKRIRPVKLGIVTEYENSIYVDKEGLSYNKNNRNNINLEFSVKTLKNKKYPTIEILFKKQYGVVTYANRESHYYSANLSGNFSYFYKNFELDADYNYTINKSINTTYENTLVNASLQYQKRNSLWNFGIDLKNIFDVNYKKETMISDFIISEKQTYISPFNVMFSVKYKL